MITAAPLARGRFRGCHKRLNMRTLRNLRRPSSRMSNTMPGSPAPEWHIRYRKKEAEQIRWFATPEEAIETACGLTDNGCEVFEIGLGSLDNSISKEQIARIYDIWAKYKARSKQLCADARSNRQVRGELKREEM
jgi:hypothetical protein